MVLHTEGVVVEMVERMVDTIRRYYKDVEIAVDDIDLDAGTLTVRRSYGEGTTKSAARADTIPLHRDLVALMRALLRGEPRPQGAAGVRSSRSTRRSAS